jgi:Domain of unknown function (DUF3291)
VLITMTDHHLAVLNVGRVRAPLDAPAMAGFAGALRPINALADTSPGFVWRLTDGESDDATSIRPYGDDLLVNLSVWESREALWTFTYRTDHLELLRRRREWFVRMEAPILVLWWVPAGHIPTVEEALERLERLRGAGPGPDAFTFREFYDAAGTRPDGVSTA